MKKSNSKNVFYTLALMGVAFFITIAGCKKDNSQTAASSETKGIASEKASIDNFINDLMKIKKLGFDPLSAQITADGYIVEGDILLTKKNLNESVAALSKQQGQYASKYSLAPRTIKLALANSTKNAKFDTAFDQTVAVFNDLKLSLSFVKESDTSKADVVVVFKDLKVRADGTYFIALSGFPDSNRNPSRYVSFNTNSVTGLNNKTIDEIKAVLCHELGHTLGLRHTDYKNRIYSKLTSNNSFPSRDNQDTILTNMAINAWNANTFYLQLFGEWKNLPPFLQQVAKDLIAADTDVNEGDLVGTDFEAHHIYGTPLSPTYGTTTTTDPLSLMLSHSGPYANLTFSLYDHIAFFGLYGNSNQTDHIQKSLTKYGNITAHGKTLKQIVDEVKALNP